MPNDDTVGKGGWGGENVSKSDGAILECSLMDTCIMSDPSPPSHDFIIVHYAGQQRIRGSGLHTIVWMLMLRVLCCALDI